MRCRAALTMGLTQRTRWTVFRLVLRCFCIRGDLVFTGCDRTGLKAVQAGGRVREPRGARFYLAHRSVKTPPLLLRLIGAKRQSFQIDNFHYSTERLRHYDRPTPCIAVSGSTKVVQISHLL